MTLFKGQIQASHSPFGAAWARSVAAVACVGALVGLASACATTASNGPKTADIERPPVPEPVAIESVTIAPLAFEEDGFAYVDGRTGESLSFEQVAERAKAADVVLVGEQHDLASHHEFQAKVIRAVASTGGPLAVAMEMVASNHADAMRRFSDGEIDADGLAAATNWEREWGHLFEIYRPILDEARAADARLYGVNAPRTLVRALAKKGVEGLSAEEREQLPELDMGDEVHKRGIQEFFERHHPAIDRHKAFDSFYRVQVLWDEAMAANSAKAFKEVGKVVVVAGNGHIAGYRAIPRRLQRRAPSAQLLTIVPVTIDSDDDPMQVAKEAVAGREADIIAIEREREVLAL